MYRTRLMTFFGVLLALGLLMAPLATASSTNGDLDPPNSLDVGSKIAVDGNENESLVIQAAPPSPAKVKFEQVNAEPVDALEAAVYIVRLQDPPLATYRGGITGLRATNPTARGNSKLNVNSADSTAYRQYLANQQARVMANMERALNRSVDAIYQYDVALNGMAVILSGAEATIVANLSDVASVQKDFMRQPMTDVTPDFLGATNIWHDYRADLQGANEVPTAVETAASGMAKFNYNSETRQLSYMVSVSNIVTITAAHIHSGTMGVNGPALHTLYNSTDDTGAFDEDNPISGIVTLEESEVAQLMNGGLYVNVHTTANPAGEIRGQIGSHGTKGEGIIVGVIDTGVWPEHPSFADDGSYSAPENWNGGCSEPEDETAPYTCTNKLVGVQHFLSGYIAGGEYDGLFISGRDDDGHGTHTASTAAGNQNVTATLLGVDRGTVSGIAPRAHVASYKGCGANGCSISDLVAAIDTAVADGVDVINYSIGGGSSDPWDDGDALAFLAARDAGIFVATSAGNSGPEASTLGSPADAPWITAVGASTSNRHFLSDITISGPGTPPTALYGGSVSITGTQQFNLVDAEGITDTEGDTSGMCLNPFNPGTFQPNDAVLCNQYDFGVARVTRVANVATGGGGAVLIHNSESVTVMPTDNHSLPTAHMRNEVGQLLKDYLVANANETIMVTLNATTAVMDSDPRVTADVMASFSSRGPNPSVSDLIKPDVTAPGFQILAGASPEHAGDSRQGELFQSIMGTSMSSPHVAGAGALMKALHPNWSPAEIQSALMSTANSTHLKEDGTTPADPFDMGAGRIDLTVAGQAGLVLDETKANYLAANPAEGGQPSALNLASLGNGKCVGTCSWTRTVSSTLSISQTWNVTLVIPEGVTMTGTVSPTNFTLDAGASQALTVEVNVLDLPAEQWAFAQLQLEPVGGDVPSAHMPIAVNPSFARFPDSLEIKTRRNAGSLLMKNLEAIEITDLKTSAIMVAPNVTNFELSEDPTNDIGGGEMYDDLSQVFWMTMTVPANTANLVAEILASESPDLDMAVGFDSDGDGQPELSEEVCLSAGGSWNEFCSISAPSTGTWWVVVLNWQESATAPDAVRLATAIIPKGDDDNLWVTGPSSVPAETLFDLRVYWNMPEMSAGERWYGAITLGSDADNPSNLGTIPVYLNRHKDDVSKSGPDAVAPGEIMTYNIEVQANLTAEDLAYSITDTLPEGTTYVEGSATATAGTVEVTDNTLTWNGLMAVPQREYVMTSSANNPMCNTPFGGYVNLEDFGILAQSDISGDSVAFTEFTSGNPINFYGIDKTGISLTDDGFAFFDSTLEGADRTNTPLPDASLPNDLLAMYWRDLEIVYDAETNRGVSLAQAGDNIILIEYDDVEPAPAGSTSDRFDFQLVMTRAFDDAPGAYEIVYAYDNLVGDLGTGTIGLENQDGTVGLQYGHNDLTSSTLSNGLTICFDWYLPLEPVKITYQVMVDAEVSSGITNTLTHNTDNLGSMEATASASTEIDLDADGIGQETEGNAPNNGDGNNDGTPDNEQANVASLPNTSGNYVTLAAPAGVNLTDVDAIGNPAAATAPENIEFPQGFFDFGISGITAGDAISITLILHEGETVESYWKYGPTADDPTSHWYEFNYDGTTGAEMNGNTITLHFVDGERGDADLTANGVIKDPGAPAIVQEPTNISLASLDGQLHIMWQQLLLALLLLLMVAGGASVHVWRKAYVRA